MEDFWYSAEILFIQLGLQGEAALFIRLSICNCFFILIFSDNFRMYPLITTHGMNLIYRSAPQCIIDPIQREKIHWGPPETVSHSISAYLLMAYKQAQKFKNLLPTENFPNHMREQYTES